MNNIFIDCGAHLGESVEFFLKKFDPASSFQIHSFECNPRSIEAFKRRHHANHKVKLHEKAGWVNDGGIEFYLGLSDGCSVIKEKVTGNLDKENPIRVESISLSRFIKENFLPEDNIVLKIDIEGAEYAVLNDLCDTGAIKYVKSLFGEWHYHKIGMSKVDHDRVIGRLSENNLRLRDWCAITGVLGD